MLSSEVATSKRRHRHVLGTTFSCHGEFQPADMTFRGHWGYNGIGRHSKGNANRKRLPVVPSCSGDVSTLSTASCRRGTKNQWPDPIIRKHPKLKKSKGENGSSPWTTSWGKAALNG